MIIQTCYPQNPVLKKQIEYYCFLKTDAPNFNSTYYAFPNTLQALNIRKNAICEIKSNLTKIRVGLKINFVRLLTVINLSEIARETHEKTRIKK